MLSNIQSLRPKYDELCAIASSLTPNIIILCESWLNDTVSDQEIAIPQYYVVRGDRCDGRKGGGVCVYINCKIRGEEVLTCATKPTSIECTWIRLRKANILLLAIYIPPGLTSTNYSDISEYIVECFDELTVSDKNAFLVVAGDLNQFPTTLIEAHLNLTQVVDSPTRGNVVLDKILLDRKLLLNYSSPSALHSDEALVSVGPGIGKSDHRTVFMRSLGFFDSSSNHTVEVWDYRESYMNLFRCRLASYPWTSFYKANLTVDEKCELFHEIIDDAKSVFPVSYVSVSAKDKPWITPIVKYLINKRYEAFRKKNFHVYYHYRNKVKEEIAKAKKTWIKSSMKNARGLWTVVKSESNKEKEHILSGLLKNFPSIQEAAEQIGEKLSESFAPSPNWHTLAANLPHDDHNWTPNLDCLKVARMLMDLKSQKSAGSDLLPPRLLKTAAFELAGPLTHLIALSFETDTVPQRWKIAKVIPIPKKANPTINNLRPVSLLPTFSKIIEKIALESIKENLITMYGSNQFGFRPKYSTIHAHVKIHDSITRFTDSSLNKAVIILSFDMRKAFDSLQHDHLIHSLQTANLPSKFLRWIMSFLQNRFQYIHLKDANSTVKSVTSGVPQGSVIAPFLFAAHMGSLSPHYSSTDMTKYADDIVSVTPVKDLSDIEVIINEEIACVDSWCQSHGLQLNKDKTKVMICTNASNPQVYQPREYLFQSHIKILGLMLSKNLKWDNHVTAVCRKASQRIFLLKKLKVFLSKSDLITVYKAIILSILEYNAPVMVGISAKNKDMLEKVHRRCHRIICGLGCTCSDFTPIEDRRTYQALKLFQALSNDTNNLLHHLIPSRLPRSRQFTVDFMRTSRRQSAFIPFCVNLANILHL